MHHLNTVPLLFREQLSSFCLKISLLISRCIFVFKAAPEYLQIQTCFALSERKKNPKTFIFLKRSKSSIFQHSGRRPTDLTLPRRFRFCVDSFLFSLKGAFSSWPPQQGFSSLCRPALSKNKNAPHPPAPRSIAAVCLFY